MNRGMKLVKKKLVNVIAELASFADKYKAQPTLAFTHFQPAQPTTVGKRATLWLQEFYLDLEDLNYVLSTMKLLGCKGTTGTQASFLELFDGDQEKIVMCTYLFFCSGIIFQCDRRFPVGEGVDTVFINKDRLHAG